MKEQYLPELNELYQKIAAKLQQVCYHFYFLNSFSHQICFNDWELLVLNNSILFCLIVFLLSVCQHDSLPQQPISPYVSKQYETVKSFKFMLERAIAFLQVPKTSILSSYKEILARYEKQMVNFIDTYRLRRPVSQLQQDQVPSYHNELRYE